jgi:hypothetical protein
MLIGYRISQAIYVAAKLGIADLLKDGPKSSGELATSVGANPDAFHRLLRVLASVGVFAQVDQRRFTLTPMGALLQTGVSGSLWAAAITFGEERNWRPWGELLYSVRTGRSAHEHVYGMGVFEYFNQHPEAGRVASANFRERTASTAEAVVNSYDFSRTHTIVDVGGGHGALLAAILKAHPHLHGTLFDLPPVVEGAKQLMEAEGLVGRCDLVAGDFFVTVPGGCDAYLLKWILHDWDDERAVTILKNCRRAMREQGKLLLVEQLMPERAEQAPHVVLADLQMMVMAGGRERTEAEFRALLDAAGFRLTKVVPTQSEFSVIEGVPV